MLVFLAQGQSPVGFDGQHKILLMLELMSIMLSLDENQLSDITYLNLILLDVA